MFLSRSPGQHGAEQVCRWIQRNERQAEVIWLCDWRLGAKGGKRLADVLQSNESMREVGLGRGTHLGVAGAFALSEAMRCHNFRFTRLFVNDQPELGDLGTMPLMRTVGDFFFGRYSRLEELSLRNTALGDLACETLSEGLSLNQRLKSLQLDNNRITCRGAIALAAAFERNATLVELDLSGNRVGSVGAFALARVLADAPDNGALQVLRLEANVVCNRGALELLALLKLRQRRRKGFQLLLFANPVQPSLLQRIKALNVQNPPTAARSFVVDALRAGEPHSGLDQAAAQAGGAGAGSGQAERSKGTLPPVKVQQRKHSPYLAAPWAPAEARERSPLSSVSGPLSPVIAAHSPRTPHPHSPVMIAAAGTAVAHSPRTPQQHRRARAL